MDVASRSPALVRADLHLFYRCHSARTEAENGSAISGAWLLTVVATESLCTLGTMVAPLFAQGEEVLFTSLAAYFLGAMFYIVLITLILYRWMFKSMAANMLTPPDWINMGALAITTLAGARLLKAVEPTSLW
jgi:tellurite resistance protein TehA-like permease